MFSILPRSRFARLRASGVIMALVAVVLLALRARNPVEVEASPAKDNDVPAGVVRLTGSPEEIGRQHGTQLRDAIHTMVDDYVANQPGWDTLREEWLRRTRRMKAALPRWYLRELRACAEAAGIDEDILLFAQCEGDIRGLGDGGADDDARLGGCTSYVAFGPSTANGHPEMGRNFDYWGLESTRRAAAAIHAAGSSITLHSVAYRPEENAIWVAHGRRSSAHLGTYVKYDIPSLLRRQ